MIPLKMVEFTHAQTAPSGDATLHMQIGKYDVRALELVTDPIAAVRVVGSRGVWREVPIGSVKAYQREEGSGPSVVRAGPSDVQRGLANEANAMAMLGAVAKGEPVAPVVVEVDGKLAMAPIQSPPPPPMTRRERREAERRGR